MIVATTSYTSPVGPLTIAATGDRVVVIAFAADFQLQLARLARHVPGMRVEAVGRLGFATDLLDAYFGSDVGALNGLRIDPAGTPFQRTVWHALREIPAGATVSYGELARRIGSKTACRAVGAANGANPIVIAIPCHRVIGGDGRLTGYGGGLERKQWLLDHESAPVGRSAARMRAAEMARSR